MFVGSFDSAEKTDKHIPLPSVEGIAVDVVVIGNAPDFDATPFRRRLDRADLIIAADGGANALHTAGILPHVLIGDMDSVAPEVEVDFRAAGVDVRRYPPAKDETDLELALVLAAERGARQIDILGALGGRWDQTLANVAMLALPDIAGCTVRMLDRDQELYLVRDSAEIRGMVGDTVSLLPIAGSVHGIWTDGLRYPLAGATLAFERSRGVSNVIESLPARVRLAQGLLLVVHHQHG
jgi:thiamine pyrophosphokinase